jgi:acid phosphatase type 7
MAPLNILRTILRAVPMRSHAARYAACVLFACVAAVVVAVPVFGQTTATTATLVGAGDIANCTHDNDEATAQLLGSTLSSLTPEELDQARVLAMGDNAYPRGNRNQYANCYDNYRLTDGSPYNASPSHTDWWGQYKDLTMPVLGNHEYMNSSDPSIASKPYFDYFSAQNGFEIGGRLPAPVPNEPANPNQFGLTFGKGYYSYNLGSWHIVALNSNCEKVGGCDASSPQGQWLENDLAAHAETPDNQCTLAYFHHPLYATGTGTRTPNVRPFWEMLYTRGADVILSGHAHRYERHAPRNPDGQLDSTNGIRQFVVGTGGEPGGSEIDTSQVPNFNEHDDIVNTDTFGVLKLDLGAGSYSWTFVPIAGQTFTDSGSGQCHGEPSGDTTPPDTFIDSGPSGTVNTRSATFTFSSSEPGSTFECSLDNADIAAFRSCSSPKKYTRLANGNHTFYVRATDAAGNTDQIPASLTWTVQR